MNLMETTREQLRRLTAGVSRLAVACLVLAGVAIACDTPVYEYALLHWPQDDTVVYYLREGAESPTDAEANALLGRVAAGEEGHANLALVRVDARDAERLTPDARRALELAGGEPLPRHVVVSPKGRVLLSGRMTVADVRDLMQSPKTATLADMLARGAQGTLVLLTDDDPERNGLARDAVRAAIQTARAAGRRVGMLELSRQDSRERWLVRQLLAAEADLSELRGPMVFGVYGRGHATEAYVGKGINATNLADLIAFMNGPCTCDIRAAGLGVDLVTNRDWGDPVPGPALGLDATDPGGYVTFGD